MNIITLTNNAGEIDGDWYMLAFDALGIQSWTDHAADAAIVSNDVAEDLVYRFNRSAYKAGVAIRAKRIVALTAPVTETAQDRFNKEFA